MYRLNSRQIIIVFLLLCTNVHAGFLCEEEPEKKIQALKFDLQTKKYALQNCEQKVSDSSFTLERLNKDLDQSKEKIKLLNDQNEEFRRLLEEKFNVERRLIIAGSGHQQWVFTCDTYLLNWSPLCRYSKEEINISRQLLEGQSLNFTWLNGFKLLLSALIPVFMLCLITFCLAWAWGLYAKKSLVTANFFRYKFDLDFKNQVDAEFISNKKLRDSQIKGLESKVKELQSNINLLENKRDSSQTAYSNLDEKKASLEQEIVVLYANIETIIKTGAIDILHIVSEEQDKNQAIERLLKDSLKKI